MIKLDKIIIHNSEIQLVADRIAHNILDDIDNMSDELIIISVLKGSIFWLNDVVKHFPINLNTKFDFIQTSSYGDNMSPSNVRLIKDVDIELTNKNVLIVEDIIDTGYTMKFILNHFKNHNPKSIKICTLLNKKIRRKVDNINADYVGFEIDDVFVAGHGFDPYRHLPDIYSCVEK